MSLNFLLCMLCLCFGMRKHVLTFEQSSFRIQTSQIHGGAYFSYEVYPRPRSVRTHIPRRPSFTLYESCPCPAHDSGHARGGRRKTCIRQGSRMRLGVTAKVGRIWKWSNGVKISEKGIFWCVSITNNVESCKKFNEKAQTVNFSVFTMCGRELPAEETHFWWKLAKRKRIFLDVSH